MKTFVLLFCLFFAAGASAQDFGSAGWPEDILRQAKTAESAAYLTQKEKDIIYIMNLARLRPSLFAATIEGVWKESSDNAFGQTNNLAGNRWFKSLIRDLEKAKPQPVLVPEQKLWLAARFHATEMGRAGRVGHSSLNGRSFAKRLRSYYNANSISENCDYGNSSAIDIVMSLLVDQDVPSLGHRKNILSGDYGRVGVSVQYHKTYRTNTVMDFAN